MPAREEFRQRPFGVARILALLFLIAAAPVAARGADGPAGETPDTASEKPGIDAELRVVGMTFVGSRGDGSEFVLRARRGVFEPSTNIAKLQEVEVVATDEDQGRNFLVTCERGEFNVQTNDFLAEGDVRGTTGSGERYFAPWVRYDHDEGVLYSDATVTMQDETGTFRGDGFRYQLDSRRFRLLGHVSVVQAP